MIIISPSVLASDFSKLGSEVTRVCRAGAEYVHLDVMDGVFVPNISFGPCVIKAIRPCTDAVFDVHLMIVQPEKYINAFRDAGADIITFHYEATDDPAAVIEQIKQAGCRAGISIKPRTNPDVLFPLLDRVDHVLVMTVEPGFGGQKLIPATLGNVRAIREELTRRGITTVDVATDGGITPDNIAEVAASGANVFVAGSSVFRSDDAAAAIASLRARALSGAKSL